MPSSPRKLESARANGAKSQGPVTEEGRQTVARSAVKHGLTAQTVVLDNESADEYEAILQCYLARFLPQCIVELDLVHQLAASAWRLARSAGVEAGLLNGKMQEQQDRLGKKHRDMKENQRVAIAFDALADNRPSLLLVNRYQTRFYREYHRSLQSLFHIQAARISREAKLPNKPNPISEHQLPAQQIVSIGESTELPPIAQNDILVSEAPPQ